MVKAREKEFWRIARPVGAIKISSQELFEILQDLCNQGFEIKAKTKRYNFENIEDIKENLALFQGKLEVEILEARNGWSASLLTIRIRENTEIFVHGREYEPTKKLLDLVVSKLAPFRIPAIWPIPIASLMVWAALSLTYLLVSNELPLDVFHWKSSDPKSIIFSAVWLLLCSCFLFNIYLSLSSPVKFVSRKSFWERNKDTIVVGVIMLIIGILLTSLIENYFGLF